MRGYLSKRGSLPPRGLLCVGDSVGEHGDDTWNKGGGQVEPPTLARDRQVAGALLVTFIDRTYVIWVGVQK